MSSAPPPGEDRPRTFGRSVCNAKATGRSPASPSSSACAATGGASALPPHSAHTSASPPIEDLSSGTIRGRRAFLEGTPSATRLLMGLPLVGQVLSNWIIDVEVRVAERRGQVIVGFRLRTTLPQSIGHNLTSKEFEGLIADFHRLLPTISLGAPVLADPIIGPSEALPDAFTRSLRYYSRCATLDDLRALRKGEFPFVRYLSPSA